MICTKFVEIALLVLEKIFVNINTCKYASPYSDPSRPQKAMI
jgi:hypothetical protein